MVHGRPIDRPQYPFRNVRRTGDLEKKAAGSVGHGGILIRFVNADMVCPPYRLRNNFLYAKIKERALTLGVTRFEHLLWLIFLVGSGKLS
jgi:hypothetical protein